MTKKNYNEIEVKDNMNVEMGEGSNEPDNVETKQPLKKVVSVQPKKVKRTLMGRLVSGILGPDGLPNIGTYVNEEIIKPAIKNIIVDGVTSGINMLMYGEKNGPQRGGYRPHGGRSYGQRGPANYSNMYSAQHEPKERKTVRASGYGVDEFIIEDRLEASHILTSLVEYADRYNIVSIADYYDSIGIPTRHTDNNYGWTLDSIHRATILPTRGGFIIKFPPVEVIQ